jgi:subtilisin family serine protease
VPCPGGPQPSHRQDPQRRQRRQGRGGAPDRRNFTNDIPLIDGLCEHPSCVDPVDEDDGHGTHVAGLVAAGLNGLGTAGVAPKVTLVNIRGARTPASCSSGRWSTRSSTPAWSASTSST